ncbi:MAG: lamin tail domain-containing protein [Candidatus Eisenbacteria bacterium]|nr:lamin tail domain-containing protein [Candidatus Eisenbacteria bacterium]
MRGSQQLAMLLELRPGCRAGLRPYWVLLVIGMLPLTGRAEAAILLNELSIFAPRKVELYNSGPLAVDVTGWKIAGNQGEYIIPGPAVIAPGAYKVFAGVPPIFDPIGGEVLVIDSLAPSPPIDGVNYGVEGGAPAPFAGLTVSLCRAPDGSAGPPANPPDDALFWTIDLNSTFGAMNDQPAPDLGSWLCINEIQNNPGMAPDSIEVCNPPVPLAGGGYVNLGSGWFVTTAAGVQPLSGAVPPGGFLAVQINSDLRLSDTFRVDLYAPDSTRVFQKSFFGARSMNDPQCYGDCPDGAAPEDGFDFWSCGGDITFFEIGCSLGEENVSGMEVCHPPSTGVEDGPPPREVKVGSWGKVKSLYRR